MHRRAALLLPLLPAAGVLGCANPGSNACASFISAHPASCATFFEGVVTATAGLPSWGDQLFEQAQHDLQRMPGKSCYTTPGGPGPTAEPTTTTKPPGGGGPAPTGVTTTLPASSGAVSTSAPITVKAGQAFDGGMKKYDRSPKVCKEQKETGEADTIFILEDGATLSNVIIGPNQAEGVHCKGTCTINNVWWEDVCEDAITFKQKSGTSYINGGGAFHAADKIVQFNGFGTVSIRDFYARDYGKVARSCGNCSGNGGARHLALRGVVAVDGGVLCGINTNYGDTCTVDACCQDSGKSCDRYRGNADGDEPEKIGSGPDGTYCKVTGLTQSC